MLLNAITEIQTMDSIHHKTLFIRYFHYSEFVVNSKKYRL